MAGGSCGTTQGAQLRAPGMTEKGLMGGGREAQGRRYRCPNSYSVAQQRGMQHRKAIILQLKKKIGPN